MLKIDEWRAVLLTDAAQICTLQSPVRLRWDNYSHVFQEVQQFGVLLSRKKDIYLYVLGMLRGSVLLWEKTRFWSPERYFEAAQY